MQKIIYILDACALIAFLNMETGAENLFQLFQEARLGVCNIMISVVNLCEVFYDCLRTKGIETALNLLEDVKLLPVCICREIGDELVLEVSRFKVEWKLSLADAFAAGLTKLIGGKLVTTDHHEFDPIAKGDSIKVFWLR